ncbi:MAG: hypothetical protein U9O90_00435 [Euryarchaeota archaeon]|nr:hypothetical protein [Euryarchaeota archaeon]
MARLLLQTMQAPHVCLAEANNVKEQRKETDSAVGGAMGTTGRTQVRRRLM